MQAFELALNNLRSESKNTMPLATEVKLSEAAAGLKMSRGVECSYAGGDNGRGQSHCCARRSPRTEESGPAEVMARG